MKYTVISSSTLPDLIKKVNEFIGKGWQLQGGFAVSLGHASGFYQAMVKNK